MRKKNKPSYRAKAKWVIGLSLLIIAISYFISVASSSVLYSKNSPISIRAASVILLIFGFFIIDHLFDLRFKTRHYVFIIIIAIAGVMLSPIYFIYPQYDKLLHFSLPILLSSIVFYTLSPIKMDLKWKLTTTFFMVIGMLGIFEIGEYLLDIIFDLKIQGVFVLNSGNFEPIMSRIDDTMVDMMLGVSGSLIYAIYTALFFRKKR